MFEIIRFLIMAEIGDVRQLRITCVWFTSANVISLKVWSITKIVINSNCDDVTMTEKINERSAYKALNSTHRWATNSAFVDVSNAINYQYSEEREKNTNKCNKESNVNCSVLSVGWSNANLENTIFSRRK